ncbi:MAG TPA: hypothetical protein VG897_03490 [Terriglobales bacterium]|nr:hypothetical protein [Terriglobales bacterium]
MIKRRKFIIPLVVLAILIAIGVAVLLRKEAPPEPVRLLPEAQAYIYLDLNPLRRAGLLQKMPPVQLDPEYDQFVKETGFQFERDLEEAAIAVHEQPPAALTTGKDGPPAENRYSEVVVAHFDGQRARSYLMKVAQNVDTYRERDIFNIPRENRTVRVCILGPGMIAVSNTNDPAVIRGIIDRYRKLALPFRGPRLVKQYHRKLPFGTLAWAIADIGRGSDHNKALVMPGGFDLFFPPNTIMIASVSYLTSVDLNVQAVTTSDDAAQRVTDQLNAYLAIFRTLEMNALGSDPDVKTFFESIKIEQDGNKAELTADLPKGFLKKLLTEPPPEIQPAAPAPEPQKPEPKHHRKRRR